MKLPPCFLAVHKQVLQARHDPGGLRLVREDPAYPATGPLALHQKIPGIRHTAFNLDMVDLHPGHQEAVDVQGYSQRRRPVTTAALALGAEDRNPALQVQFMQMPGKLYCVLPR